MKYADVLLPLPLAETYTYALPAFLQEKVRVGCRLVVPFGVRKIYSAIVVRLHDSLEGQAATLRYKEAIEVLDLQPVVLPQQLRLWRWIADYYLCTLGEVYKAALPSGMKLESESIVVLNPDYDSSQTFTPDERRLLQVMETQPEQRLSDLQALHTFSLRQVKSLLAKGVLVMKEEVRRGYRPLTTSCVRLAADYLNVDRLSETLEQLRRSPRQQQLLTRYLILSQANAALRMNNPLLLAEVDRQTLMEEQSDAALRALRQRGILELYDKPVSRLGGDEELPATLPQLSAPQQHAKDQIDALFQTHDTCLLHGVTGSGKTEVYIQLIHEAIQRGSQVLYLLPEIVLTAQLVDRLRRVFGSRLGVYHSKYSDAERVEVWQKQLSSQPYDIIVGVRSSVFLPFQRLGLVIVDEEHETSFKQQDPSPRYHGRNVALVLARMSQAKTLLGTATPSIETYHHALQGRYGLVTLTQRYGEVQLPEIQLVDTYDLRRRRLMSGPFSPQLLAAMRRALEQRQQVILFQNRRGYAPQIECHVCGWTPRCQNCDVTLTLHRQTSRLTCHYCGATYPIPQRCPNCESTELRPIGYGTERIENDIHAHFPQARVARMDLDTTRSRAAYEHIISDFQHGRTDILVGTQMVTKGLDFQHVSLVGILSADSLMNMPDFRSYERAFQQLTQVSGRAGRRTIRGEVILQTRSPREPLLAHVLHSDYPALYHDQMQEREAFRYPPFCRLVYVYLRHRDSRTVDRLAADAATLMRQIFSTRVLGPDRPPVARIQQSHIRKLILKLEPTASLVEARRRLLQIQTHLLSLPSYRSAHVYYDVDPV